MSIEHSPPLVVVGAGGHGKVVADALLVSGETILGFVDDRREPGSTVYGLPVLGPLGWFEKNVARAALAIGDNVARRRASDAIVASGSTLVRAIHPRAVVSPSARVDAGAVVMALAVLNPDCVVEQGAIVNTGAIIEHDCIVGAFAHVSPNAVLAGGCRVGAGAHVGVGAAMLPGRSVGEGTVVGGGALVARDLPAHVVAYGVPAHPMRNLTTGSG